MRFTDIFIRRPVLAVSISLLIIILGLQAISKLEAQEHMGIRRRRKEDWLGDMIQIMVYQELFRRRCDHRKCRRNFYF